MRRIIFAIAAIAAAATCQARTIIVDDNSPADFITIQAAINDANNGDTIIIRPGQYIGNGNRDIRFFSKAITVRSIEPNDPNIISATVVNCQGSQREPHRGFTFDNNEGPNSVLAGLTITNGWGAVTVLEMLPSPFSAYVGGGILCINASPTIMCCHIKNNTVAGSPFPGVKYFGGGICYWGGSPTIVDCIIKDNSVKNIGVILVLPPQLPGDPIFYGGGIYGKGQGTIIYCDISENIALTGGGGIYVNGNNLIDNCIIRKNTTRSRPRTRGGGIYVGTDNINIILLSEEIIIEPDIILPTNVKINNCIISENIAEGTGSDFIPYQAGGDGLGGGVYSDPCASVSIEDCLILANRVKGGRGGPGYPDGNAFGGGIYCGGGEITSCTFTGNMAMSGAGIYGQSDVNSCILWDVTEQNSIPVSEITGSALVRYSDIKGGFAGEGNINTDPCFVESGYWIEVNMPPPCPWCPPEINLIWNEGDYHLLEESQCINRGEPNYVAGPNERDLDGKRRVTGGRIDMGAYELPNTQPVADAGQDQTVYAWIDGIAEVTLDGSGSYDEDGDELTYLWTWSIDGNTYDTNCVKPTIELPVGLHTIELVVNDGWEDSEPNEVVITVVEAIKGSLWMVPRVINGRSGLQKITATLRLPEGVNPDQIDTGKKLLLYPGEIKAERQTVSPGYINAVFDKAALMAEVANGNIELIVAGKLISGQCFYGTDTVRIIHIP